MKKLLYYLGLQIMLLAGCKGQNEQLKCFDSSMQNEDLRPLFVELRNGLNDTLKNWINVGYKQVQIFDKVNWKIDEGIFISEKNDKAILLILEQDTAKFTAEPTDIGEKLTPTYLDYVHLIYSNKEIDGWHYYYQSMELLVVPRPDKNKEIPTAFEQLSLIGRINILKGYYNKGTCKYNDKYFDRWDIKNLKEQHKKINGY